MTLARRSSRLFGRRCARVFGARFAGAPQPTGEGSTWSPRNRCSTVFRGWPIFAYAPEEGATKTTQKWGFFRALQLADKFTGRANCIRVRQISPDVALFFGGVAHFCVCARRGRYK